MCCFAQPVLSVTDTNLFARLTETGTQFLAYQMKFSSKQQNAMILPLPVENPSAEDGVRFISLKKYKDFFKDLNNGFPYKEPPGVNRFAARESRFVDQKLVVHDVGDFIASFVPTINDFSRLDSQFVIPKESWNKISGYSDFGFAVFQLKKLSGTTHPMAMEFKTRHKDEIFFPTVHIHDGQVHKREKFDHTLYLQSKEFDERVGQYRNRHLTDSNTGFVRSKNRANRFCKVEKSSGLITGEQLVHRIEMKGVFQNKDVVASLSGGPFKFSGLSFGKYWPMLPFASCVAGLAWIFNRREELQLKNKT